MMQLIPMFKKVRICFLIKCVSDLIPPQEICEIKTNISGYRFDDAIIILNGELDCDGYISLSYEDKEGEIIISVKNNIEEATWRRVICDYEKSRASLL